MSRTKSHSSTLATIKDLADKISQEITAAQDDFDKLIKDSERLKEIEPAANRFFAVYKLADPAMISATAGSKPESPKPGDLCKTCENELDNNFDCTHDAAEACGGYSKVKRTRTRKTAAPEENKLEVG